MRTRNLAPYEDEERVVYYDLEENSHNRGLLLSTDNTYTLARPRAETTSAAKLVGENSQIFARQRQPQFLNLGPLHVSCLAAYYGANNCLNKGNSGDEGEEEGNPFATLLEQQYPTPKANKHQQTEVDKVAQSDKDIECSLLSVAATSKLRNDATRSYAVGRGGTSRNTVTENFRRSILKSRKQCAGVTIRSDSSNRTKFGFEAASCRPERWRTSKPSTADTKNRRKSLGAIQKRLSSQEAADSSKRRKSMPADSSEPQIMQDETSTNGSVRSCASLSNKKSLFDILQRATTLYQQHNLTVRDASLSQVHSDVSTVAADAIYDTEQQMRAELFAPNYFSPTKTFSAGAKSANDSIVGKIRGNMGDMISKAIRKRNRDLTLLRSKGQHLLPIHNSNGLQKGTVGPVESIQGRAWLVVQLKRRCKATPNIVLYECQIHEVTASLEKSAASSLKRDKKVVKAYFDLRVADRLRLADGQLLKIYAPLHFVSEHLPAGSTRKSKWFMLGTQLAELLDGSE